MTAEILPLPLRPDWEQVRAGVQRPASEAARSIVCAAVDPALDQESGLVIDPEGQLSEALSIAITPDLTAEVLAPTAKVLT